MILISVIPMSMTPMSVVTHAQIPAPPTRFHVFLCFHRFYHISHHVHKNPVIVIAVTCVSHMIISLRVYRLWLSPIASFPGPNLAALAGWYGFYYTIMLNGLNGVYVWRCTASSVSNEPFRPDLQPIRDYVNSPSSPPHLHV